jgi:integrase
VPLLEELHDHLVHERGVSKLTANDRLRHVFNFWEWAFDHDDYPECPRPKRIELPEANPKLARVAPTWEQMDEGVHAAGTSWYWRLFVVLRYTGLRRSQAMQLLWTDFDFEAGSLSIRPELGKTRQERRGRVIPVSPHLLEELAGWGRRDGYIIDTRRVSRGNAGTSRTVHHGYVKAIWKRTSVPEDRYRQPCHCFRKGFISGLLRSGAREYAVKRLVGHASGVTIDVYADDSAIESDLRAAVAMIPQIAPHEKSKVISLGRNGVSEGSDAISVAKFGAAE